MGGRARLFLRMPEGGFGRLGDGTLAAMQGRGYRYPAGGRHVAEAQMMLATEPPSEAVFAKLWDR